VKLRITPGARSQLLAATNRILRDNPSAAVRFRRQVEKAFRRLERFPKSGSVLPEFPDRPYREVFVAPYRIFYRVQEETVWVVAVWHGAPIPREPTE
jgi:plasmid stabilization system protein ParE